MSTNEKAPGAGGLSRSLDTYRQLTLRLLAVLHVLHEVFTWICFCGSPLIIWWVTR